MKIQAPPYLRNCLVVFAAVMLANFTYANPVGFASMNGGTTGGAGGTSITVTNGADLYAALKNKSSTPLTITVNGTITPSNTGQEKIDVKDVSDVTIIGAGSGARFSKIGIKLTRAHNIILRNLIIHEVDTGDKDGISIEGASTNIWIDHNELYSSLNVDKDYYDGLLDSKSESEYITISYNYLHDSWKSSLHGSGDSDSGNRNITFHHNHFENLYSRGPLFRFGVGHLFNNYYNKILDTGINSRMGARLRIENNHFENTRNPVVSFYSSALGYWDLRGNKLENVTWVESPSDGIIAGAGMQSTVSYTPPYSYSLDNVECVKSIVLATAGAGKGLATSNGSCNVQSSSSSSVSSSRSSSSSSSVISSSSIRSSSSSSSSIASSSSSATGGTRCNWYGTTYPLCANQSSDWGWENNQSCIGATTCSSQPAPFGIINGSSASSSSIVSSSSSSVRSSSSSSIVSSSSSSIRSSSSSSVVSSSSSSSSVVSGGTQCNWYGSIHPLCQNQSTGWGWENNQSCVGATDCSAQTGGGGIIGASSSSVASSSSSVAPSSSSVASSSSSVVSSSSVPASSSSSSGSTDLGTNLALGKAADGTSKGNGTSYGSVFDGKITTYWQPSSTSGQRVSIKNLTSAFNTVIIRELNGGTTSWRLVNNDNGAVLGSGTSIGAEKIVTFASVSASKVNLMIDSASSAPQIAEIEIYNASGSVGSSSSSAVSSSVASSVSSSVVSSSSSSRSSVVSSSSSSVADGNASGLIGFATISGYGRTGTNGGQGGPVVTVSNFNDLVAAVADDSPRIVQISGTISGNGTAMVDVGSNKTIIGLGSNATISGFGLDINGWGPDEVAVGGSLCDPAEENTFTHVQNVIVRNINFMNAADDSINVQCYSHHIWIDHNTFYPGYDGSVDVKRGSDLVTISFNRFDGTDKTMLLGHSADNGEQDRGRLRVTYHDNWFDGSNTRSPRVRFGYAHVFNNYYNVQDYVFGLGIEAKIYAEGNYVAATKTITQDFSESSGYHLTWASSNYYNTATITRANDSSSSMKDWLDADGQVSRPTAYSYTLKSAPSSPPAAGAGRL